MSAPATRMMREMVTPEGVDLQLRLADIGERASAFFLDMVFMGLLLLAMTIGLGLLGIATRLRTIEFIGIIWILGFFFLRNFYFTAFELTLRAATPGKRIVGLRVAMRDGTPLTANAVFARNAMRELEVFLPASLLLRGGTGIDGWIVLLGLAWCGGFVLFPWFNRDRLRVGDMVAGTWVVVAPKRVLDSDLAARHVETVQFSAAALDAYGIKELGLLEDVLRRRDPDIMTAVAKRIRAKIGFGQAMYDGDFLDAYYIALRNRLEGRLLLGRRRRDKYDTD